MSERLIAYWFARADEQGRAFSPNKPYERWTVGQTRTLDGEILPCKYGFHGSPTLWQALRYAPGPLACKVELGGTIIEHGGDKVVASQKTLLAAVRVERELRLFAVDCAEHVLHIYESAHPNDDRPRRAIAAARDYAEGRISADALAEASMATTKAAMGTKEWGAWRAACAAIVAWTATVAAVSAANNAVAAVADGLEARSWEAAARVAESEWQRKRFEELFAGIFDEGAV